MLGDDRPHLRDLGDLTPLRPCLHAAGEPGTAAGARRRLVDHHVIRVICQFHRRARLPLRAARLATPLAQRLRRRLGEPVRGWRLAGVPRVLLHLRGQGLHPGLQLGDLRHLDLQRRDDLVLLGQQLPQPPIRGTQTLAGGTQPAITSSGDSAHRAHGAYRAQLAHCRAAAVVTERWSGMKRKKEKGFQGSGYVTPAKKPQDRELYTREHEYNNQVSSIRAPIERAVAHLKTWKILFTDYRRPLNTFLDSFRAAIGLYFFELSFR